MNIINIDIYIYIINNIIYIIFIFNYSCFKFFKSFKWYGNSGISFIYNSLYLYSLKIYLLI